MLQSEATAAAPRRTTSSSSWRFATSGRTVEYVLYPEEFHVVQASGRIDRRVDRMTRMLAWFERFLVR